VKYLVTVLPREEISDPEGEVILDATRALGFAEVRSVRAGKAFVVEMDEGSIQTRLADLADRLLANPLVERFFIEEFHG
jgi:phosphoribosylformylglycinamidine synthase